MKGPPVQTNNDGPGAAAVLLRIDNEIIRLQELRSGIENLFGMDRQPAAQPLVLVDGKDSGPIAKKGKKIPIRVGLRIPNGMNDQVLKAAARAGAVFDVNTLCKIVGNCTRKQVSSAMAYLKKTRRLTEVEAGRCGHPTKFKLPDDGLKTMPTNGHARRELEEKLEQAIADRDKALGAGREPMGRILSDKVNKLQAELEEMRTP